MEKQHWLWQKGTFLPLQEGTISIQNLALTRGYSVFEFLRTYNHIPFMLDEHIDRLKRSLDDFGLDSTTPLKKLPEILTELITKTSPEKGEDLFIKIIAVPTESTNGLTPSSNDADLLIHTLSATIYPEEFYTSGVKTSTIKHHRFLPTCKYTSYVPGAIALKKALQSNIQEVLYINENDEILEGCTTNFFAFINDQLITPSSDILEGVTRKAVLEIIKNEFEVEERSLSLEELEECEEAFITSTTKEIMPVRLVDHIQIGDGHVGPRTKRLIGLFQQYIQQKSFTQNS